ncbi:maleylpyruvate isomerase N-terminal domain-containing protein [Mycobacterium sp.]|jgi:hypothetical protein|uniref:maleylpyruvate isomerase N-terminal domain-containing protein n=1 Tax=Mycobacterium sp. TaxID=1785 RepID=UPI003340D178|nr:hypothetical protein [Mycobacterium sp.]
MTLDFDRHCAEVVTQTSLLIGHLNGADLTVPVPTCPGWNVSQLARHVDGGQRWAREIVATRALAPPSDVALRDLSDAADYDPDTVSAALTEAAAALALGLSYSLEPDVAADAVDEWMELGCMPFHFEVHPWMRELLAPGRTIGLHATDTDAHWLLDLTGDVIAWRRADEPAAAEILAPVTDLLLTIYRRRPAAGLDVTGDAALVDFWLERVAFG